MSLPALVLIAGCGTGLPETIEVSGQVTYDGEPLDDGVVIFHPQEIPTDLSRHLAKGNLDKEGRFTLSTFGPGDGAVRGRYRVTIHSYQEQPDELEGRIVFVSHWRIPERYGNPESSGLSADVTVDVPLDGFHFNLQD